MNIVIVESNDLPLRHAAGGQSGRTGTGQATPSGRDCQGCHSCRASPIERKRNNNDFKIPSNMKKGELMFLHIPREWGDDRGK